MLWPNAGFYILDAGWISFIRRVWLALVGRKRRGSRVSAPIMVYEVEASPAKPLEMLFEGFCISAGARLLLRAAREYFYVYDSSV